MKFTGPQQMHKALNILRGVLEGVSSDGHANRHELSAIRDWRDENIRLFEREPCAEIGRYLTGALQDGVLDVEEVADLIHLCKKLGDESGFFAHATATMQVLHGMMKGISMDGEISKSELEGLRDWMADNEELSSMWPFTEVFSIVLNVLGDGRIDQKEHDFLLAFFGDFSGDGVRRDRMVATQPVSLMGICETGIAIDFQGKVFCLTGASARFTRKQLQDRVLVRGGQVTSTVSQSVRYLVVCDEGNKAWAFTAYGRKVEKAVSLRQSGHVVSIISEADLLDALTD